MACIHRKSKYSIISIHLFSRKSDKMVEVIESKRFMEYTLTSRGFISVDNTNLIDNILTAINTRFSDVLQEDLEPTVISALRLWPAKHTAGMHIHFNHEKFYFTYIHCMRSSNNYLKRFEEKNVVSCYI